MTLSAQWPRVKEIVGAALECDPVALEPFLAQACGSDHLLRSEVDSLLAASRNSADLSLQLWPGSPDSLWDVPKIIGPYELKKELGTGGMGQVWLAEQKEPVHRKVALKLIRVDLRSQSVKHKFLSESQTLASMNHPAIAGVLDAGTTPAGQPYLVMEYIEGCAITTYCDQKQLKLPDRLALFQLVCEGVQHAHHKAIIHRDLKPSNILIAEIDGKAVPKIIDFGIAKDTAAQATLTQATLLVGTLGYMSPEQCGLSNGDVDTRTDVYSLGVVLYELLTGLLPSDLAGHSYYDILRELRESDPIRPSARLTAQADTDIADKRGTTLPALIRTLQRDADAITLKALERDRSRRYASPTELAADIGRYLGNQPVTARESNSLYLLNRYVRRHRTGVLIAALSVLVLIGFVIAQAVQLRNTRRQRDRADRIADFMVDMFKVSDPSEARGSTISAREILDNSSQQIDRGIGLDAPVQTQLMEVMARTYTGLGLYTRAETLAGRALSIRRRAFGAADPNTFLSLNQLAEILDREGRVPESEALMRSTLAAEQAALGPKDRLTLRTMHDLASLLERNAHFGEAEKLERQVLAVIKTKDSEADKLALFRSRNTLAGSLKGQNRFGEAEDEQRRLLNDERNTLGPGHPFILVTMHNLANTLADQGRSRDAEALDRQTLDLEQHILGPEHPDTASTMTTLANTLAAQRGHQAEAEALYRRALAIETREVGPDHQFTTNAKEGLANLLSGEKKYGEAERLLTEVLATRRRSTGPNHTDTLLAQYNLAEVLFHQNRLPEAEKLLADTIKSQTRILDATDPDTMASLCLMARVLFSEKHFQASESFARQAFTAQRQALGPQHPDTQQSLVALARALVQLGRYPEARSLYTNTIAQITASAHGEPSIAWYNLACIAAGAGQHHDAISALQQAFATGYSDLEEASTDADLAPIRRDPAFLDLVSPSRRQKSAAPSPSR